MMRSLYTATALLLLLLPDHSDAQTIRGEIVESVSSRAVRGALVILVDRSGTSVAGSFSDGSGRFTIHAPQPGEYRLRARRVGYETTTTPEFRLFAATDIEGTLELAQAGVPLEGITVEAAPRCNVRSRADRSSVLLWDEIQNALQAAAFVQRGELYQFRVRRTTRTLQPGALASVGQPLSRVTSEEHGEEGTNITSRPFSSVPIGKLLKTGFIEETNGSVSYFAPDAELLLSDEFLDEYCLEVASSNGSPELLGLSFRPVSRRGPPGIAGTLWIERATRELRRIDFRYVRSSLPEEVEREIGGSVEFEALPNGAWVASRWSLRMPTQMSWERQDGRLGSQMKFRLTALKEETGEVLEILPGAGSERSSTIAGMVFDSIRHVPLRGALVFISGTQYSSVTDSLGTFRIDGLPAREVMVSFTHPDLARLGVFMPPRSVSPKPAETISLDLALSAHAEIEAARRACPEDDPTSTRVLLGRIEHPMTGEAVEGVSLRAESPGGQAITVRSESDGVYIACGLPRNLPIRIHVRAGDLVLEDTLPSRPDRALAARDFVVGGGHIAARPIFAMDDD